MVNLNCCVTVADFVVVDVVLGYEWGGWGGASRRPYRSREGSLEEGFGGGPRSNGIYPWGHELKSMSVGVEQGPSTCSVVKWVLRTSSRVPPKLYIPREFISTLGDISKVEFDV